MPINARRLTKRIGFGLLILLLLAGAAVTIEPFFQRWRAEQLLALLQQTMVGKTTLSEFRIADAKQLRFIGLSFIEDEKGDSYDVLHQSVTNPIGVKRFAPWSTFTGEVVFHKGVLVRKSAHFASGTDAEFAATVTEWLHQPEFSAGMAGNSPPPPHHWAGFEYNTWHRLYVSDDTEATEAEKQADWTINLACMTKFGGCHDPHELFPDVGVAPPQQEQQNLGEHELQLPSS
jgi:hypothetical protein